MNFVNLDFNNEECFLDSLVVGNFLGAPPNIGIKTYKEIIKISKDVDNLKKQIDSLYDLINKIIVTPSLQASVQKSILLLEGNINVIDKNLILNGTNVCVTDNKLII